VCYIYLGEYEASQADLLPEVKSFDSSYLSGAGTQDLDGAEEPYSIDMLYNLVVCLAVQSKYTEACQALDELTG
jgi:hypothetical protein